MLLFFGLHGRNCGFFAKRRPQRKQRPCPAGQGLLTYESAPSYCSLARLISSKDFPSLFCHSIQPSAARPSTILAAPLGDLNTWSRVNRKWPSSSTRTPQSRSLFCVGSIALADAGAIRNRAIEFSRTTKPSATTRHVVRRSGSSAGRSSQEPRSLWPPTPARAGQTAIRSFHLEHRPRQFCVAGPVRPGRRPMGIIAG
jgi:hypothetical protein